MEFAFAYFDMFIGHHVQAIAESGKIDVEFVFSREEAEAGDENTFYFWPSERTERMVVGFNRLIQRDDIELEPFSLSYPLALEDFVERWENVWELFLSLDARTHSYIIGARPRQD